MEGFLSYRLFRRDSTGRLCAAIALDCQGDEEARLAARDRLAEGAQGEVWNGPFLVGPVSGLARGQLPQ